MEMDSEPLCPLQYLQRLELRLWPQNNTNTVYTVPRVHVNPNFKSAKKSFIHVNPRMHQKPMIHVNPKMMKEILPVINSEIPRDVVPVKVNGTCREIQSNAVEKPIQKSIHVNPKLMEKLSSIARADIEATTKNSTPIAVANSVSNKTNLSDIPDNKVQCKTVTTQRLLAISRRKLVRIDTNNQTTGIVKARSPAKIFNGTRSPNAKTISKKSINPNDSATFATNKHTHKLNTYKIDRTAIKQTKPKAVAVPDVTIRNVNKGLVAIGGVMYQSSRTRLVRSRADSSVDKKRKSIGNTKSNTFVMARNGKKLQRLSLNAKNGTNSSPNAILRTSPKKVPTAIAHSSHKNVISYKAKQRSLQILRDKHRKNFIPCLIFRRFGYCANHAKGTCTKLHDKKQVALCRNFLQGKCLRDECPMSHDIGPEKMPTCKYFLEGCCIRDACPYLHVKVSPNTPLCAQFLRGYCAEGSKCKQRHAYICPEFEKVGTCPKGKHCPYPHKLKSAAIAASVSRVSIIKNTRPSSTRKRQLNQESSKVAESGEGSRKRYYDNACPSDEQVTKMRENILKQISFMKATKSNDSDVPPDIVCLDETIEVSDNEQEADNSDYERPKRPPIGPLPAYIPIN